MKPGSNVKDVSYMGYREEVGHEVDRPMYHLYSNRAISAHWRDTRNVECGSEIANAFRADTIASNESRLIDAQVQRGDSILGDVSDTRGNSNTRVRFSLQPPGVN